MSVEQVAMAMWAGDLLRMGQWLPVGELNKFWRELDPGSIARYRTHARTYLRALGRIK